MRRAALLLPLCGALLLVACSGGGERPGGEAAPAANDAQAAVRTEAEAAGRPVPRADARAPAEWDPAVRELVAFVERHTDARFRHPTPIEFVGDDAFEQAFLQAGSTASEVVSRPPRFTIGEARALGLRHAGPTDPDMSWAFAKSVDSYYDYRRDTIVVRGPSGLTERTRAEIVRQLTHAIRDQEYDFRLLSDPDAGAAAVRGLHVLLDAEALVVCAAYVMMVGATNPCVPQIDLDDLQTRADPIAWEQARISKLGILGVVAAIKAFGAAAALRAGYLHPPATEQDLIFPDRWLRGERARVVIRPAVAGSRQTEIARDDFGMAKVLLVLTERFGVNFAWPAATAWAGGASITYLENDRTCVALHVAGDGPADLERLMTAFEAWAFTMPAAQVSRFGGVVRVESCEGADTWQRPAGLPPPAVAEFLAWRFDTIDDAQHTTSYLRAVCVADEAAATLAFAHLFDSSYPESASVAEAWKHCPLSPGTPTLALAGGLGWDPAIVGLVDFVERERRLPFLHAVPVDLLPVEEFETAVSDAFAGAAPVSPPIEVARALGLASGEMDVTGLEELSGAAIDGFYDPRDGRIRVRGTDLAEPLVQYTLVHELTHALQDQHIGLERPDAPGYFGVFSPFRTLVEGDATRIALQYLLRSDAARADFRRAAQRDPSDVGGERSSDDLERLGVRGLQYYGELIQLPYAIGATTSAVIADVGGVGGLNDAFASPPTSEEQLLHPDRWLAGERIVDVPPPELPPGAEELHRGPFGMVQLLLMLSARLGFDAAWEAVDGWGGDALLVYRDNGRTCVRLAIAADSIPGQRALVAGVAAWAEAFPPATWEEAGIVTVSSCDPGRDFRPRRPRLEIPLSVVLNTRVGLALGFEIVASSGAKDALCFADALLEQLGAEMFVMLSSLGDARDFTQALRTCDIQP